MAQDIRETFIQQFRELLVEATGHLDSKFFNLPIVDRAGVVSHMYRERVYCYELYHCMRTLWRDDYPFTLQGEVDKNGHPIFQDTPVAKLKPDFLVHIPSDMGGNLIVVEVKAINTTRNQIEKDLCSLSAFKRHGRYDKGIYLVYGGDEAGFTTYKRTLAELANADLTCGNRNNQYIDRIDLHFLELCWHQVPGQRARFVPIND